MISGSDEGGKTSQNIHCHYAVSAFVKRSIICDDVMLHCLHSSVF